MGGFFLRCSLLFLAIFCCIDGVVQDLGVLVDFSTLSLWKGQKRICHIK